MNISSTRQSGFSLIEMAVVLVILGLLLTGGMMLPLSAQSEQRKLRETREALAEIRQALLGFAVLHGRLPCPATQGDPTHAAYGEEDASCRAAPVSEGYLPWKTLEVAEQDAWGGGARSTAASDWRGVWRYRVHRNFSDVTVPFALETSSSGLDQLRVINSTGQALTSTTERPVAIVFSTGKDGVPNGQNTSFESASATYESNDPTPAFDDQLIWIARPVLMYHMVSAAKLPQ